VVADATEKSLRALTVSPGHIWPGLNCVRGGVGSQKCKARLNLSEAAPP